MLLSVPVKKAQLVYSLSRRAEGISQDRGNREVREAFSGRELASSSLPCAAKAVCLASVALALRSAPVRLRLENQSKIQVPA